MTPTVYEQPVAVLCEPVTISGFRNEAASWCDNANRVNVATHRVIGRKLAISLHLGFAEYMTPKQLQVTGCSNAEAALLHIQRTVYHALFFSGFLSPIIFCTLTCPPIYLHPLYNNYLIPISSFKYILF